METAALPTELRPWVGGKWYRESSGTIPAVQRRLLGVLFATLALSLGLVAVYSGLEGGSAWVIALAAAALALWLGDLARRALSRRA